MANTAFTDIVIVGSADNLQKAYQVVVDTYKSLPSDERGWDLLYSTLGGKANRPECRGLIIEINEIEDNCFQIHSEDAWCEQLSAVKLLCKVFDLKFYWVCEEFSCDIFRTNDRNGLYFPYRYFVELGEEPLSGYFKTEKEALDFINRITGKMVSSFEEAEKELAEWEEISDAHFYNYHVCEIVE